MSLSDISFTHKHRDDEHYDEIHISCKERWKTSELSGNEWRFSYCLQLKRKGHVLYEKWFNRLESACAYVPWVFHVAGELGEFNVKESQATDRYCSQPGCRNEATHQFQIKKLYSREGYSSEPTFKTYARFCSEHTVRGDCGLEDADDNYIKDC